MFKKILFSLLISNVVISNVPTGTIDPRSVDERLPIFEMEDSFQFDGGDCEEEFYFDEGNLVECCACTNWAMFIFYEEGDIYGLCAKCYLG